MNERNLPTERRIAAVELLLSLGYTWDGNKWNTRPTAVASHAEREVVARRFHEAYERLAPSFGYETRKETREFDPTSPNGMLMIAVCNEVMSNPPRSGDD